MQSGKQILFHEHNLDHSGSPQDEKEIITICLELELTFLKVANGFVIVLQLQVTLAQEEMGLDRLAVQLQGSFTIRQGLVMLLKLHVAQGPVGVVHCH